MVSANSTDFCQIFLNFLLMNLGFSTDYSSEIQKILIIRPLRYVQLEAVKGWDPIECSHYTSFVTVGFMINYLLASMNSHSAPNVHIGTTMIHPDLCQ